MIRRLFFCSLVSAILLIIVSSPAVLAAEVQTLAILPFDINADEDISYVKRGISRMLYSRLSWPDKVLVLPPSKSDELAKQLDTVKGDQLIRAIAEKTDSQYIVAGAITQLAGFFSLDVKVYDISDKRYMAFFENSPKSDELIQKVDRIAAAINQKVFDRSTVTWERMEQEREKQIIDFQRRNPEHLMQVPPNWQPKEEIGWKVWKYLF